MSLNGSENTTNIRLDFVTYNQKSPTWNLTVRQLSCAGFHEIGNEDSYWLSPIGCLQYYPEPQGFFESFNFLDGAGTYLPNQNYAICFKRTIQSQGLR